MAKGRRTKAAQEAKAARKAALAGAGKLRGYAAKRAAWRAAGDDPETDERPPEERLADKFKVRTNAR